MPDPSECRILLVDDHVLIRDAMAGFIRRRFPGATCHTAATAAAAVAAVEAEAWSLVMLDLGLPGAQGELQTLRTLRQLRPEVPILVLSMFPEDKMGVPAMEAGASGYLCKTGDRETLYKAITATLAGGDYCTPRLRERLEARSGRRHPGEPALSARETDVLIALVRGESNKEISGRLNLSASTVTTYRARIFEKLGLRTSADLMRYAVEHRLARQ